jgi:hypothetical protein
MITEMFSDRGGDAMSKTALPMLLGFILLLMSCGSPGNNDNDGTGDTDDPVVESVYPAKTYVVGQNADGKPAVWNNKTIKSLDIGSGTSGSAQGVVIANGAVYICGYWSDETNTYPCVWKDGNKTDLPTNEDSPFNYAFAIAVSGSTIYVGGTAYEGGTAYAPVYWTYSGSTWTKTAPEATTIGTVMAIAIDGSGDPWFAGTKGSTNQACYWDKAGNCTTLIAIGSTYSMVNGIAVGASTVVTGYYMKDSTKHPCSWDNGGCSEIGIPTSPDSIDGVAISGTDCYLAGVCTTSLYPIPGYWKNGTWNALKVGEHGLNSASAIVVSDSVVYVAGQYTDDTITTKGCFWAGTERIDVEGILPVYGIAVKE